MAFLSSLYNRLPEETRKRLDERGYERAQPKPRAGAKLYVAQGDNAWGNAITYRNEVTKERRDRLGRYSGLELRASGHMTPKPRQGDELLVKMASGQWAVFVFGEIEHVQGVSDMFFANARGPIRYAAAHEIPKTKMASEFLRQRPQAPESGKPELDALDQAVAAAGPESYQPGEIVLVDGDGARVKEQVFDGLVLQKDDGTEVVVDRSEMGRVAHIPESPELKAEQKARISALGE